MTDTTSTTHRRRWLAAAACLALPLTMATGCSSSNTAPNADSDSSQRYNDKAIPVDDNVYTITGTVTAEVGSLTRQTSPGRISTPTCYGTSGCYGGGTSFGPVTSGKGYVRLLVTSITPSVADDTVRVENIAILKVTDTKATALLEGDAVTFKCRRQYEAVAAVRDNEDLNVGKAQTWEMDYCRLSTPSINVKTSR